MTDHTNAADTQDSGSSQARPWSDVGQTRDGLEDQPGRWFLAACRDCQPPLPQPFRDRSERDGWVVAHAAATGHHVGLAEQAAPTPNAQVMFCPVDDCRWAHLEPVVIAADSALTHVFGPGVMAATARAKRLQRIEDTLRDHFAGHRPEEFLRTITRLRGELETARTELANERDESSSGSLAETAAVWHQRCQEAEQKNTELRQANDLAYERHRTALVAALGDVPHKSLIALIVEDVAQLRAEIERQKAIVAEQVELGRLAVITLNGLLRERNRAYGKASATIGGQRDHIAWLRSHRDDLRAECDRLAKVLARHSLALAEALGQPGGRELREYVEQAAELRAKLGRSVELTKRVRYEYDGDTFEGWLVTLTPSEIGTQVTVRQDNGEDWVVMARNVTEIPAPGATAIEGGRS